VNTGLGDDRIVFAGLGGALDAGVGDDTLTVYGSGVVANAAQGNDRIMAYGAGMVLDGGAGNDVIRGVGNAMRLIGGAGDDQLSSAGVGNSMTGGAGSDTYAYQLASGTATVYSADAGTGTDVMRISLNESVGVSNWSTIEHYVKLHADGMGADLCFVQGDLLVGQVDFADVRLATNDLSSIQLLAKDGSVVETLSANSLFKTDSSSTMQYGIDASGGKLDSLASLLTDALSDGLAAIRSDNTLAGVVTPTFALASDADLLNAAQQGAAGTSAG
jgi:Ca2+-binding RTX toxin-like protein